MTADKGAIRSLDDAAGSLGGVGELLSSQTIGSQANVDITDIDDSYSIYEIVLSGVQVDTNLADLYVRLSNDNGTSFRSSTGDYQFVTEVLTQSGGDATQNGDGVAQIQACLDIGSGAADYLSGVFYLVEPAASGLNTTVMYEGLNLESRLRTFDGRGLLTSNTEANDALRFTLDGGNFTAGSLEFRGYF